MGSAIEPSVAVFYQLNASSCREAEAVGGGRHAAGSPPCFINKRIHPFRRPVAEVGQRVPPSAG